MPLESSDLVARYRAMVEAFDGFVYICSPDFRIEYMNDRFKKRCGGDGTGELCYKAIHKLDSQCSWCVNDRVFKGETVRWEVLSPLDKRWYCVVNTPIYNGDGSVSKQAMITDITERKLVEEELRHAAERFRAMIDTAPYGAHLYELKPDGRLIFTGANQSADKITGVPNSSFVGKTIEEAFPGLVGTGVPETYREVARGGSPWTSEQVVYSDDRGISGIFEVCAFQTAPSRLAVLFHDITERKKAEKALRESEQRYRELADSLPVGVFELNERAEVAFANAIALEWFGFTPGRVPPGITVLDLITEEDRDRAQKNLRLLSEGHTVQGNEYRFTRQDGSKFPAMIMSRRIVKNGATAGFRGIMVDTTERKKVESVLQNVQKLEALGVLAGDIAHDFNNLLTGIFGYMDMARTFLLPGSEPLQCLDNSIEAFNRAKALTRQLLTFAKGGAPVRKAVAITALLKQNVEFALSGSNIKAVWDLRPDTWDCDADPNQIGQVIDNLIINAKQAMPLGGVIEVGACNVVETEPIPPPLEKGRYVKIRIHDNGTGIPSNILPRIFDPFFTTKQQGSGLGLATAYSIISRHGGHIYAESQASCGSTFTFYLPASVTHQQTAPAPAPAPKVREGLRILVMDDEPVIRDIAGTILRSLGCSVILTSNGPEALETHRSAVQGKNPFDCAILDLTIPGGMGGKEVLEEMRKIDTLMPIIASSGYSDDPIMADPGSAGFSAKIAKPYLKKDVAAMLASVLGHANRNNATEAK